MIDEGYIKFEAHWEKAPPLDDGLLEELQRWRQKLYDLQLIGAYPDGIGFGNISQRYNRNEFIISGSATGNFPELTAAHYILVTKVDAPQNQLWCRGPVVASSESMSHAALYAVDDAIGAVIHVHHLPMWEQLLGAVPTTPEHIPYGTPEMAAAIAQLFRESDLPQKRISW
jgi:L-ribulose-5-phosphate 4-epimerase